MKENEFVKKFGIDEARKQINKPTGIYGEAFDYQFMENLKRLVVSHELVESYGGLSAANKTICDAYKGSIHEIPKGHEELSLAIQDVESCM